MNLGFARSRLAIAIAAAFGATAMSTSPGTANADEGRGKDRGTYVAGDFHNHTTCSDGSISMQKLVKKATDKDDTPWGLDWFVQAGHGGNGNRNCTLVEDATLATPAYPFLSGNTPFNEPTAAPLPLNPSPSQFTGAQTLWSQSIGNAAIKGLVSNVTNGGTGTIRNMWRWQSIQEFQYPVLEYLSALRDVPLFIGLESVVAGHEHASMSVITGQMPAALGNAILPNSPPYPPVALGHATALAQWSDWLGSCHRDSSRGGGQNWDCTVPGSPNSADPSWNTSAQKLFPIAPNAGVKGHLKTVEAVKWMRANHAGGSYYVPAHLERAGPFNPSGNNGYNIEHLRNC